MMEFPILSILIFIPFIGTIVLVFMSNKNQDYIKYFTLGISTLVFLLSLPLFFYFKLDTWEMQFTEKHARTPEFGVDYHLGIDGCSLLLLS